jgi:protein-L-isoaspartate(D-aspartate) O-methyltransferase
MEEKRRRMVEDIKVRYGFYDSKVLQVMLRIPREKFIPKKYHKFAYDDKPVEIGFGQTISQPYTVALMTELVISNKSKETGEKRQKTSDKMISNILEIGTGSGYQTAILSKFFDEVYSLEIIPELASIATNTLRELGIRDVYIRAASGEWGWLEKSPFDAIMVTAGMEKVPQELFKQLKVGGVLVAPVGKGREKNMMRYMKIIKGLNEEIKKEEYGRFSFVPFVNQQHDKITS